MRLSKLSTIFIQSVTNHKREKLFATTGSDMLQSMHVAGFGSIDEIEDVCTFHRDNEIDIYFMYGPTSYGLLHDIDTSSEYPKDIFILYPDYYITDDKATTEDLFNCFVEIVSTICDYMMFKKTKKSVHVIDVYRKNYNRYIRALVLFNLYFMPGNTMQESEDIINSNFATAIGDRKYIETLFEKIKEENRNAGRC